MEQSEQYSNSFHCIRQKISVLDRVKTCPFSGTFADQVCKDIFKLHELSIFSKIEHTWDTYHVHRTQNDELSVFFIIVLKIALRQFSNDYYKALQATF